MFCKSCDAVWFIAERLENYHKDPRQRENFIAELRRNQLFTPKAIYIDGDKRAVKKLMILATQFAGFMTGYTAAEISELVARGYNRADRNAKREIDHIAAQEKASYEGREEIDALARKIKADTRAKLGHLGDNIDFSAYLGFDPTKTEMEDEPIF